MLGTSSRSNSCYWPKQKTKALVQSGEQKYLEPIATMWHNYDILLAVNSARVISLTYFHMQRIQLKMTLLQTWQHVTSSSPPHVVNTHQKVNKGGNCNACRRFGSLTASFEAHYLQLVTDWGFPSSHRLCILKYDIMYTTLVS